MAAVERPSNLQSMELMDIKDKMMLVYETETQERRTVSLKKLKRRYSGKFFTSLPFERVDPNLSFQMT